MYALPLRDESFDLVLLQMVLHYAEAPEAVIAEAARVLAPGGTMIVVDLAPHTRAELGASMGHRALGFSDAAMAGLLRAGGLGVRGAVSVEGPLVVRIWRSEVEEEFFFEKKNQKTFAL